MYTISVLTKEKKKKIFQLCDINALYKLHEHEVC